MTRLVRMTLPVIAGAFVILGTCAVAGATTPSAVSVPEIDASSSMAAIALLSCAALIIRGRLKR